MRVLLVEDDEMIGAKPAAGTGGRGLVGGLGA